MKKYNQKIIDLIQELSKKRKEQDRYGTTGAIFLVQKRIEKVTDKNYSPVDLERLYLKELADDVFYPTINDIKEGALRDTELPCDLVMKLEKCSCLKEVVNIFENYSDDYEAEIIGIEYIWETIAYFFTEEDALNYQKYQAHNLGVNRLFIASTGYDNRGILDKLLYILDTEDFILEAE